MKRLTVFVNELSFQTEHQVDPDTLLSWVLEMLAATKEIKKLRHDLIIVGTLTKANFETSSQTLASLLRRGDFRDEWRFLQNLEQASPWDSSNFRSQIFSEEVSFKERSGVGLLLALQSQSACLSVPCVPFWSDPKVLVRHTRLDKAAELIFTDAEVSNLSKREHVAIHEQLIRGFGGDLSSSSTIFESEFFTIRMYFNDHDPPHFHVMAPGNPSETVARFAIETLDQLQQTQELRPSLRKRVLEWATNAKPALMNCWADCRAHRHPVRLS